MKPLQKYCIRFNKVATKWPKLVGFSSGDTDEKGKSGNRLHLAELQGKVWASGKHDRRG